MESKELRIGNLVLYKNNPIEVENIGEYYINRTTYSGAPGEGGSWDDIDLKEISPILITEQWLVKLGFRKDDRSNEYWTFWILNNNWYISQSHHNEPSAGVEKNNFYYGDSYIEVKSIHHLQNLYFSLTGKELIP